MQLYRILKNTQLLILPIFLIIFLISCSDKKPSEIVESYDKDVSTTQSISVSFKSDVVSADSVSNIYSHSSDDKIITLDGKGVNATYAFSSADKMQVNLNKILEPNKEYKLEIDFLKVENAQIKEKIVLPIKTQITQADGKISANFSESGDKLTLNAFIKFSQTLDLQNLDLKKSNKPKGQK